MVDPGIDDSFTLTVDWGDYVESYMLAAGTSTFSVNHYYDDDGVTNAPQDTYRVVIQSLVDKDNAHAPTAGPQRVSVSSDGEQGNYGSYQPSMSADGRYVAFASGASNLVEGATNNQYDIFVRDLLLGTTQRVSVGANGEQGNNYSSEPLVSRQMEDTLLLLPMPAIWWRAILTTPATSSSAICC